MVDLLTVALLTEVNEKESKANACALVIYVCLAQPEPAFLDVIMASASPDAHNAILQLPPFKNTADYISTRAHVTSGNDSSKPSTNPTINLSLFSDVPQTFETALL